MTAATVLVPVDVEAPVPLGQMTDEVAALMVQRLARHNAAINDAEAVADALLGAEKARVGDWLARETQYDRDAAEQIETRLEEWILLQREATGGKVKSRVFPHGRITTRVRGGGWTPTAETVEWAKTAHPGLVRVVETFAVDTAKHVLAVVDGVVIDPATGETVPGITVEPKTITAAVSAGGGAT